MLRHRTIIMVLILTGGFCGSLWAQSGLQPPTPPRPEPLQPKQLPLPVPNGPIFEMPKGDPPVMPGSKDKKRLPLREGQARSYPAAGLELALPLGFTPQPLDDPYKVLQVSRSQGLRDAASVVVSAYPVQPGTKPTSIIENFTAELANDIAIRRLEVDPVSTLQIANQPAAGCRLSYKLRRVRTVAWVGCFVRTFDADQSDVPPGPVAYLVNVEVLDNYAESLDELREKVLATLKLTDFCSPASLDIELSRMYRRDYEGGFAMRQPVGWAAQFNEAGLAMGRVNYLLGDVISPSVQVLGTEIPATETGRSCGEQAIELERKQGWDIEVISAGPSELLDREAWQIVLRKQLADDALPTEEPQPGEDTDTPAPDLPASDATRQARSIEVRRLICMPIEGEDDRKKHFALILTCHTCSPERAVEMMDKLAEGFALQRKPKGTKDPGEPILPDPSGIDLTPLPR